MISNSKRLVLLVLFSLCWVVPATAQTGFDLERIQRATVFIMQASSVGEELIIRCVGTGTLVSRDGLILTNAHNTVQGENCPGNTLIVSLSVRADEAPVPVYQAQIVQADAGLDLALLRITRQNDGRIVERSTLALPFVELGDSASLTLDQTITVVGYPSFGDDAVGLLRGTVIGFTAEPSGGSKSWIKTGLEIPGTMSGGGAYDAQGRLIGVPTTAPVTPDSPQSRCITLQDSNQDGLVNTNDVCVPVGGVINALRPSSFARPLLRAASLELSLDTVTEFFDRSTVGGTPTFSGMFFAPSVNAAGMPTSVSSSLPAGTDSLYLFFSYQDMTPESVYEMRVTIQGVENPTFSLSPVRWSGGRNGLWYIGTTGQPIPNGLYDFTLFIDGIPIDSARINVGGSAELIPLFSDVVFGVEDLQGNLFGEGFVLPTGSTASARFIYRNMVDGAPWTAIWYFEGSEVYRESNVWSGGADGTQTIRVQDPNGLLPGSYRLALYINNKLAAISDFTLAGAQQGAVARIFANSHFTTASTQAEAIDAAPVNNFTAGTESIYALFDWEQIRPGTLWTMRWSIDDETFYERTGPWVGTESGEDYLLELSAPGGVPDGTYRMELFINELVFADTEARVGIGQLPIDRFAQASGIQMRGQILDAVTGDGIPGVTFVLVSADFSAAEFTRDWSQEQIYALAITDRNGRFQLDRPLQPNTPYSVVIVASGYIPVLADGVEVAPDAGVVDVPIYLTRG
ncbi:MAG: trypsin-like peptidase domain-containing protein [Chloroflexi bacterium]|uniref:trypsin-like peptidase domain-containing protein n=1 Tax=Candidatus Flexifilum breve TaxID=3140694 RepID=UPI003136CB65|nr:trypsin-like peptidase domain-containing protein [Chloroflexota bacterium]